MKKGSTDDPFADDEEDSEDESGLGESEQFEIEPSSSGSTRTQSTTQRQSLPYIHSRDGVKDGRKQRPVFLREHIEEGIDDLVDQMHRRASDAKNGPPQDREELAIRLQHSHLPKLADHGIVDYDHRSGAIRYDPDQQVEAVLDSLPEDVSLPI